MGALTARTARALHCLLLPSWMRDGSTTCPVHGTVPTAVGLTPRVGVSLMARVRGWTPEVAIEGEHQTRIMTTGGPPGAITTPPEHQPTRPITQPLTHPCRPTTTVPAPPRSRARLAVYFLLQVSIQVSLKTPLLPPLPSSLPCLQVSQAQEHGSGCPCYSTLQTQGIRHFACERVWTRMETRMLSMRNVCVR